MRKGKINTVRNMRKDKQLIRCTQPREMRKDLRQTNDKKKNRKQKAKTILVEWKKTNRTNDMGCQDN